MYIPGTLVKNGIDAVEYFVGKKLPFGYLPSFWDKGPKVHCQLLRRKSPH